MRRLKAFKFNWTPGRGVKPRLLCWFGATWAGLREGRLPVDCVFIVNGLAKLFGDRHPITAALEVSDVQDAAIRADAEEIGLARALVFEDDRRGLLRIFHFDEVDAARRAVAINRSDRKNRNLRLAAVGRAGIHDAAGIVGI